MKKEKETRWNAWENKCITEHTVIVYLPVKSIVMEVNQTKAI